MMTYKQNKSDRYRIRNVLVGVGIVSSRLKIYQFGYLKPILCSTLDTPSEISLNLPHISLLSLPIRKYEQVTLGGSREVTDTGTGEVVVLEDAAHLLQYFFLAQNPLMGLLLAFRDEFEGETIGVVVVFE